MLSALALALALALAGPPVGDGRAELTVPAQARPGTRTEVSVVILEAASRELPIFLRLRAPGLDLAKTTLEWSDVVDPAADRPRLATTFVAPAPGRYEITAVVSYSTCGPRQCLPHRTTLRAVLTVAAYPSDEALPPGSPPSPRSSSRGPLSSRSRTR